MQLSPEAFIFYIIAPQEILEAEVKMARMDDVLNNLAKDKEFMNCARKKIDESDLKIERFKC